MSGTGRRWLLGGLGACLTMSGKRAPGEQLPSEPPAALALDEAEVRERMMTAVAIANGIRTQGRALFLARHQTRTVEGHLRALPPVDSRRADYEKRLAALVARQQELDATIDRDFDAYLRILEEILKRPRVRVRRIGEQLAKDLGARQLDALATLLTLLRSHLEEGAQGGILGAEKPRKWLEAIDETRAQRRERFDKNLPPPVISKGRGKENDI